MPERHATGEKGYGTACHETIDTHEGYLTYWLSRIPKNSGNSTTEHYNWWRHIVDYGTVYQPLP